MRAPPEMLQIKNLFSPRDACTPNPFAITSILRQPFDLSSNARAKFVAARTAAIAIVRPVASDDLKPFSHAVCGVFRQPSLRSIARHVLKERRG
jgi:hypothetical protein